MPFEFASGYVLPALAVIPLLIYYTRRRKKPALRYSDTRLLRAVMPSFRSRWAAVMPYVQWLAVALLIVGMARPRLKNVQEKITAEGIDIVMALDVSRSMLIEDIGRKNRLEAAKEVAVRFVERRTSDRVALVVFAGKSFTQCPLTTDYAMVIHYIRQTHIGMVEDGTAIGMGIVNSVNRLRESTAKSKIIILLTDGQNNRGEIDPITSAQIAKALNIRIYTIGAGKDGIARIPVDDPFFGRQYVSAEVKIDEPTLKSIAEITGGQYYRATTENMLEDVYRDIEKLEKTKIEVSTILRYKELYPYFLMAALGLLLSAAVLSKTLFSEIP